MRPIKFRAWDGFNYMSSPFTLFDIQSGKIRFTRDVVIMQFTGLHDKNGREIYEGDLLGEWLNINGEKIQTAIPVLWSEEIAAFMVDLSALKDGSYCEFLAHNYEGCEIIGNIFENPELLTK